MPDIEVNNYKAKTGRFTVSHRLISEAYAADIRTRPIMQKELAEKVGYRIAQIIADGRRYQIQLEDTVVARRASPPAPGRWLQDVTVTLDQPFTVLLLDLDKVEVGDHIPLRPPQTAGGNALVVARDDAHAVFRKPIVSHWYEGAPASVEYHFIKTPVGWQCVDINNPLAGVLHPHDIELDDPPMPGLMPGERDIEIDG